MQSNIHIQLLQDEVQDFIWNYSGDIGALVLSGSPFPDVPVQLLAEQIQSRRKAEGKLPGWYQTKKVYYPPKLNLEQTSSVLTAQYKASLVKGNTLADITGGFGVDSFYFSEVIPEVLHIEQNEPLSNIAQHNFKVLSKNNITTVVGNGLDVISKRKFDIIYADPSRRHQTKGKVFYLTDCEPNIPKHISFLLDRCETLVIKTSPMLDLSIGLEELQFVSEIHIIAIDNEVKESIWILQKGASGPVQVKTVNLTKRGVQSFSFLQDEHGNPNYSQPLAYLYEPNAAIRKSGAFNLISERYALGKLHPNSHLYTGDAQQEFPGRVFKIDKVIPYTKKNFRKSFNLEKANVTVRNFPETVATIRKKWKIKDGGDVYLFFTTTLEEQRLVLVCSKVETNGV